ncbi:phosphatase YcdX [Propionicimonas sp. T2.31MG-18]|uniref:PHP domain-containing protein n=1 Tax=Propionicimonas sp. T2.31MG-18 TaxID=3157620 RepID=UPI0035EC8E02
MSAAREPVAALREIAYLMERVLAEPYRVRAFRAAADVVEALPAEEFARHARAGSWRELPGLGQTTATVVAQAVAGRVPDRLAALRAEAGPLAQGGEEVLGLLRGDLHTHTDASDGTAPVERSREAATALGRDYLAITDHSPRLTVANGLSVERLRRQVEHLAALNSDGDGCRLLSGIEVDILADGGLDQVPDMLSRLDIVVSSVHSELRMESEAMTRRMVAAVANPFTNVLGHCTGRLITGGRGRRPPSTFDAEVVFEACRTFDVAVEINSRPERADPPDELLALAVETGCLFAIDSDAHAPGQLEFPAHGAARAAAAGVPTERIVNTWPVEDLLAWSRARRGK